MGNGSSLFTSAKEVTQQGNSNSSFKYFIAMVVGYFLWNRLQTKSEGCYYNKSMITYKAWRKNRQLLLLDRCISSCSVIKEELNRVISCMPGNCSTSDVIRIDKTKLEMLYWKMLREKHRRTVFNDSFDYLHKNIKVISQYTLFLQELACDVLQRNVLETEFWRGGTHRQIILLNELLDKLKATFPKVPVRSLHFAMAYVFNRNKKTLTPDAVRDMEEEIKELIPIGFCMDLCPICGEAIVEMKAATECDHIFHSSCIVTWFNDGGWICPVCGDETEYFHLD